MEQSLKPE
jgi:DNA-binding transcriptional ArsR family regulator